MATDKIHEPEAVVVEELCRAVALRAHDVGWAAYLLGRAVATAGASETQQPLPVQHHQRIGALLDAEERLLGALVAVFERLGCLDGLDWLDVHVSHELKMQMKAKGGRA